MSTRKEKEFQKIMDEFSGYLRSLVLKFNLNRLGLEAEDLMQDVRLKIWKIIINEKKIDNPASYLRKVVETAVLDQIRKIRREEEVFTSERQKLISEIEPKTNLYHNLDCSPKEYILKAADSLMDSRKTVVKLYLLNMNLAEISAYLNYSRAKTRNLLYRGLADLRTTLKEMGFNYEKKRR
jgi:RNA polymerase sigma-70 factor (ECF subfamily)